MTEKIEANETKKITDELLTEQQAAHFLGVAPITLWRWRKDKSKHLKFYRHGWRIFYKEIDLREHFERCAINA